MEFVNNFFPFIKSGWKVLDVGAGAGKQANHMATLGAKVIAIDKREPLLKNPGVKWEIIPVEDYIKQMKADDIFDAILMRNSLQVFEKDIAVKEILPQLFSHLKSGGVIAIETFYKQPIPPFQKGWVSLWTEDELKNLFNGWLIIASGTKDDKHPDLKGEERLFFMTKLLAQKP